MRKVLFIGSLQIKHIRRLVSKISSSVADNLEIQMFDYGLSNNGDYPFRVHSLCLNKIRLFLIHLPKIGVVFRMLFDYRFLSRLMKQEQFSTVILLSVPMESYLYVKLAHKYKSKSLMMALGSDILRVNRLVSYLQKIAFDESDYVAANKEYRFSREMINKFDIPDCKCVPLGFGADAITLIGELKGKYSKEFMQERLNLPHSVYTIVCGYNATLMQRHEIMIKALLQNIDVLPNDYLVIVPLTYGINKDEIIERINKIKDVDKLNIRFLEEYMTAEEVAYLRLITDLFIHVQTTDAYNASLQEFILAGAQCINGAWLEYDTLEKNGVPYYKLQKIEDLPNYLRAFFTNKLPLVNVTDECVDEIRKGKDWSVVLRNWKTFLTMENR